MPTGRPRFWVRPVASLASSRDHLSIAARQVQRARLDLPASRRRAAVGTPRRASARGQPPRSIEIGREPAPPFPRRRKTDATRRPGSARSLHLRILRRRQFEPFARPPARPAELPSAVQHALHLRRRRSGEKKPPCSHAVGQKTAKLYPQPARYLFSSPSASPMSSSTPSATIGRRGIAKVPDHRSPPHDDLQSFPAQERTRKEFSSHTFKRSIRSTGSDRGLLGRRTKEIPRDRGTPPLPVRVGAHSPISRPRKLRDAGGILKEERRNGSGSPPARTTSAYLIASRTRQHPRGIEGSLTRMIRLLLAVGSGP